MLQLGMVLERYSDDIIRTVTSPITGIQRRCKWPPSIAEIVAECDHETERQTRIRDLSSMRRSQREPRPARSNFANVLVRKDHPRYAEMAGADGVPSRKDSADPREWRWDDEGRGIWVVLGWLEENWTPPARAAQPAEAWE